MIQKEITESKNNTKNFCTCSDCGNSFNKEKMQWGHNSWNDKKHVKTEHAYVCGGCWENRAKSALI